MQSSMPMSRPIPEKKKSHLGPRIKDGCHIIAILGHGMSPQPMCNVGFIFCLFSRRRPSRDIFECRFIRCARKLNHPVGKKCRTQEQAHCPFTPSSMLDLSGRFVHDGRPTLKDWGGGREEISGATFFSYRVESTWMPCRL